MNKRTYRANRWAWLGFIVVIGVLLILGSSRPPTEGTSEDRLYDIASDMKCVACVGESVANSQASIAIKMRSEIREQMEQGKSNDEIFNFFVERYDQRVLLNPPASGIAGLVWIVPVVVLGAGVAGLGLAFAKWRSVRGDDTITASEQDKRLVEAARKADER